MRHGAEIAFIDVSFTYFKVRGGLNYIHPHQKDKGYLRCGPVPTLTFTAKTAKWF